MNDWLDRKISEFRSVTSPDNPREITVGKFFDDVRKGRWKDQVAEIRASAARLKSEDCIGSPGEREKLEREHQKLKRDRLPAVTPSGTFRHRRNDGLKDPSNVLCLDYDNLDGQVEEAKAAFSKDPHTAACFESPSGGLKVFVLYKGDHRSAFDAAEHHYAKLGYKADQSCKDVTRLCYGSYDSRIFVSPSPPEPFVGELIAAPSSAPSLLSNTSSKTISTSTSTSTVQVTGKGSEVLQGIAARKRIEADPDLKDFLYLYDTLVAPKICVEEHKRNEALTQVIPFLYNAVCKDVAEPLIRIMLELNRGVYTGTIEEQMASFKSLWDGCERNYSDRLSSIERSVYEDLPDDKEREAFRLCRDLAMLYKPKKPKLTFFLAANYAQLRLGINLNSAVETRF